MLTSVHAGALSADDLSLFTALYREHCEVGVVTKDSLDFEFM